MQEKRILVTIYTTDLIENTKEVIKNCEGVQHKFANITYQEDDFTKVQLKVEGCCLNLQRYSQNNTTIKCDTTRISDAKVTSSFGVMNLDVKTEYIETSESKIETQYSLFQQGHLVSKRHVVWEYEEVYNESN